MTKPRNHVRILIYRTWPLGICAQGTHRNYANCALVIKKQQPRSSSHWAIPQSPKQLLVNQQYTFRTDAFNILEKYVLAASLKFKESKFERFRHCLDNVQLRLGGHLQSLPWLFRLCSHLSRRENHISSYTSAFYVVLVESLWIPPAEGGFPSLHMLDSLSKSVFLHTNKWVPPYLIRVSLIQQAQTGLPVK